LDYPLENLGPERFQHFCQALLVTEFPRLQCFPVGQPDGGRDAVSYRVTDESGRFLVFQVKYARKPLTERDAHNWLLETIAGELPKITELRLRGATEYILLTNVAGTSHLDVGSIDRLNQLLAEKTGLPSQCWWRDDLNRRLDNAWALKWVYPELMTGPDLIRALIESGSAEITQRRAGAIKAFIRDQHDADEDVRFKQVDLHNKLLDLFIDVPVSIQDRLSAAAQIASFHSLRVQVESAEGLLSPSVEASQSFWNQHRANNLGAAKLLLNPSTKLHLPRIVIEGAPGQGKSTITQYICQIHRKQLLRQRQLILEAESEHQQAVMLPIRIDLRDLATWFSKRNPFSISNPNEIPDGWHRSLEAFLAALVRDSSGGFTFSVDDLSAVFRQSSVLLVFDGLDEVADILKRSEIVDEITRGVQRLEENTASMQVVITSRPAAFANSPGMPSSKYTYLQLESLNKKSIIEYANKWLKVKDLDSRQQNEFRRILNLKLDQPHLRDLARNPMQLAILLSLILTRGPSLPDKRTALYVYYIDLFFSREAEKSIVVRDYRQLLIDFHGYLGWLLHCEAELGETRPSITRDRLEDELTQYLAREGHDSSLAKTLLEGMIERVVAIVSRIEGTYEFEVQPLREFFAAYHLYDTAPPSSTGRESAGSKPDRFDALARNFYWLNVIRFFAGFYSKGELPSLIQRLEALTEADGFDHIGHPSLLTLTLLSDWVFNQNPRSVREAITLITSLSRLRYLTASRRDGSHNGFAIFKLPPKCGREELVRFCIDILSEERRLDFTEEIIGILRANNEEDDIRPIWRAQAEIFSDRDAKRRWIMIGFRLGLFTSMTYSAVETILDFEPLQTFIPFLFSNARFDFLCANDDRISVTVDYILGGSATGILGLEPLHEFVKLGRSIDLHILSFCFQNKSPASVRSLLSSIFDLGAGIDTAPPPQNDIVKKCQALREAAEQELELSCLEWATSLKPWETICELGRSLFGERLAFLQMANIAAGLHSITEQCADARDLFDQSLSLCRRIRYARLRSGQPKWWKRKMALARTELDLMMVLTVLLSWASDKAILALVTEIDSCLNRLSLGAWEFVFNNSRHVFSRETDAHVGSLNLQLAPTLISQRTASILVVRSSPVERAEFFRSHFGVAEGKEGIALEFVLEGALDLYSLNAECWAPNLSLIRSVYACGFTTQPLEAIKRPIVGSVNAHPNIANEILRDAISYPGFLVSLAEESRRASVARKSSSVSKTSQKDGWFALIE